jgi:hypothetical protein
MNESTGVQMKKISAITILAVLIVKPAFAMSDSDKLIIGTAIAMGFASLFSSQKQQPQRFNPSLDSRDSYRDTGLRALGKNPMVQWEINDNPDMVCRMRQQVDGRYFDQDGCSFWSRSLSTCTVVTKSTTNHMTLGRLFLACQNGG